MDGSLTDAVHLVFNFTKTFSSYPLGILHSNQECVSSIVSSETQSIKTCYISLFN